MAEEIIMVTGSLNRAVSYFPGAHGVGLSVWRFDPITGAATLLGEETSVDNPSFISIDPVRQCLYACSEVSGWHEGCVSAYRYDPKTHRLRYLNKQLSLGSTTAYSSLTRDGRYLLAANYGAEPEGEGPDRAAVLYPLQEDGSLGSPCDSAIHRGSGPNAQRQERSHPHCALPSPDGRFIVIVDLGLDAILSYHRLSQAPVARLQLPAGAGPRHLAFHPANDLAVVICELNSTLASLRYEAETGRFAIIDSMAAIPGDAPDNHCSDVQIHPNGRFVYGANRGHDSIVIAMIDPSTGKLTRLGHHPCGGRTPRNLAIDPTGRFLLVANQDSDCLAVLAINPQDGTLTNVTTLSAGTPMCIEFMRV